MEANLLQQLSSTSPAQMLVASIWQGLLLTAFAWAALRLVPTLRAATRFAVWLVVFLIVALLPYFALLRGLFSSQPFPFAGAPQATFSLHLNPAWAFAFEGLWAITSLFSVAHLLFCAIQMHKLYSNSTTVPFVTLDVEIQATVTRAGSRPVEIRLSDAVDAPSVIGFLDPAVVIPRWLWNDFGPADLKQVILHEMAHLDRRDDWTNLLQKLLRSLCPLNVALIWAERQLCRERELACDDAVLDAAGNARAYATCLTRLAESRLVKRAAALAPGLWKRHSELAGRVENILHRRRPLAPAFARGLVATSLLTTLSGAIILQRCPGFVSFASNPVIAAAASEQGASQAQHFVRAKVQRDDQPRFEDAVFHPTINDGQAISLKHSSVPKARAVARATQAPSNFQFFQIRSTEDLDGEHITLILFTVEVPQTSKHYPGKARQVLPSTFSIPDDWIAFQI